MFVYFWQMIPIFFAIHKPNYVRWMVLCHLNLVNMDITHPSVRDILARGGLCVQPTNTKLSRCPVDLTLEQAVNRDAASRQTGIAALTVKTHKRWTITHSTRGAIVGKLLVMAGLSNLEEVSQESKPYLDNRDIVASELKDPICHSDECQIGSFSSEATI